MAAKQLLTLAMFGTFHCRLKMDGSSRGRHDWPDVAGPTQRVPADMAVDPCLVMQRHG